MKLRWGVKEVVFALLLLAIAFASGLLSGCYCARGCTEGDAMWYGFWIFLVLLVIFGAIDLWHRWRGGS